MPSASWLGHMKPSSLTVPRWHSEPSGHCIPWLLISSSRMGDTFLGRSWLFTSVPGFPGAGSRVALVSSSGLYRGIHATSAHSAEDLLGQGSVRRAVLAVGVLLASAPLLENQLLSLLKCGSASARLKGSR